MRLHLHNFENGKIVDVVQVNQYESSYAELPYSRHTRTQFICKKCKEPYTKKVDGTFDLRDFEDD